MQEEERNPGNDAPEEARERRIHPPSRLGLIFNTPDILVALDEYQGTGVGVKAVWQRIALRGLLGLRYESGAEVFDFSLGSVLEYHLTGGRVLPYIAAGLQFEYERNYDLDITEFTMRLGPIFGVEIAPFDVLSVFAEYQLEYAPTYARTPDGSRWNYRFATGLGNRGAIGIVVYFFDRRDSADAGGDGGTE